MVIWNVKDNFDRNLKINSIYLLYWVGYEQIVSLLILNGANVNEIMDGETALHVAAAAGNLIYIICWLILLTLYFDRIKQWKLKWPIHCPSKKSFILFWQAMRKLHGC